MSDVHGVASTLPYGACVLDSILTAGQPEEAQFAAVATAGCKLVLDLRGPHEPRPCNEPTCVAAAGMEYLNIPITPETLQDDTFNQFRSVMRDTTKRPILIHCASSDRVGALLLPYFILDEGKDRDTALGLAIQAGLRTPLLAEVALDYAERAAT